MVIEKPIGRDLASATAINDAVGAAFAESQTFRIDHYLGKETVQNLLALRFGNALFEPLWNAAHIDHVQITVAETVGVETARGVLRHAPARCATWCRTTCCSCCAWWRWKPPASLDADAVRDEKLKVLRSLKPHRRRTTRSCSPCAASTAPARPTARRCPATWKISASPRRSTETFVALKAEVGNWRWAGVPFYLRTGKRLPQRVSEIVVQFRSIPHSIFAAVRGTGRRRTSWCCACSPTKA